MINNITLKGVSIPYVMPTLDVKLEHARLNPLSQGFSCTRDTESSQDEVELDLDTFKELWDIANSGYINNIGSHINHWKHLIFYEGVAYTTATDHMLRLKVNGEYPKYTW
ncbi:hypothetical protein H6503_04220 [Candidatus Woesearchaeota archaeon]|nr:hypothetical protein [Candidatus Woesearchaeota archaeon]